MVEMSSIEKFSVNTFNEHYTRKAIQSSFNRVAIPENPELLELGAGKGVASYLAFSTYAPKRLVVTDYDPSQVEEARKYIEMKVGKLPETVEFRTADVLNLSFEDASFDMVFGFLFLHHLEENRWAFKMIPRGIDEIHRVLKPGGVFVYGEVFNKGAIRQCLKSKGLREVFSSRRWGIFDFCACAKPKEQVLELLR